MTDKKPYLSLAMIVGDAGVSTLPRLLDSVLNRSAGPMVDEIVICWNGTDDEKWYAAMERGVKLPEGVNSFVETKLVNDQLGRPIDVTVRIVRQTWPGRFDVARNESFRVATGEWVIWLDSDDTVADADKNDPENLQAIERCEQDYGIPPPPKDAPPAPSLKQWLAMLPWDVNCVLAPYDYTIDENGYVVVRQKMKRIVRRSAGFIWWSPDQSGVHEVLYPLGNVAEKAVETYGALVRHRPAVSDADRAKRNREIIFELSKLPTDSTIQTGRHQYDLANSFVTLGEWEKADASIKAAIMNAQSPLDTYTYRLARASLCAMRGNHEGALGEAFAAIGTLPELQDAYFVVCEAFFLLGKWDSVVEFYERGAAKKPSLLSKDQPLFHFTQPRVQAAMAWGNLGEPEKGLPLAQEALARYPKNALAQEGVAKLTESIARKKAVAAYLDLAEFALEKGEWELAHSLLAMPVASLRGIEATPRYRVYVERLEQLPRDTPIDVHMIVERDIDLLIESAAQAGLGVKVVGGDLARFDVGFYCPHAIEQWWPRSLDDKGLGGSESSVAYLARELFKLGVRVTTYTPHGDPTVRSVKHGIIEKELTVFSPRAMAQHDVLVSCRAPWLARRNDLPKATQLWVWHQDNHYNNPWTWSPEVDERIALNLHVSQWAKRGLIEECYGALQAKGDVLSHIVLGNGIDPSILEGHPTEERPLRVIFCSDPSRGLAPLIDAWDVVRRDLTTAELHIYCGFRVSYALAQASPGMPQLHQLRALEQKVRQLGADPASGVKFFDWCTQKQVVAAMKEARIYCYPGGPMPEGYGVSLAQAQAAGCFVLAPKAGALPEVLDEAHTLWMGEQTPTEYSASHLGHLISNVLTRARNRHTVPPPRMDKHLWPNVAKRFVKLLEERVANPTAASSYHPDPYQLP